VTTLFFIFGALALLSVGGVVGALTIAARAAAAREDAFCAGIRLGREAGRAGDHS
jgi:hypothetical protein